MAYYILALARVLKKPKSQTLIFYCILLCSELSGFDTIHRNDFKQFKRYILCGDGSRGHIFTTAVAIVCAVVEFFTTVLAVAVFGWLTTAVVVAVVGCDVYEN